MRYMSIGIILVASASASFPVGAQVPASEPLLRQARAAYEARATAGEGKLALELFEKAAKAAPSSYEARWEGARMAYLHGNFDLPADAEKDRLTVFQRGIDLAEGAVALRADGVEGHFWRGVLLGSFGETKGIFKALGMAPEIRKEMETCLKLDGTVECFGPQRVLGRLYFKLPGFKGGDNQKSLEYLEKAVQGCPSNALARLFYAETLKALGQKEKAKEQLRAILTMQPDPRWAPEHPSIRADAQKLLKKLGG